MTYIGNAQVAMGDTASTVVNTQCSGVGTMGVKLCKFPHFCIMCRQNKTARTDSTGLD